MSTHNTTQTKSNYRSSNFFKNILHNNFSSLIYDKNFPSILWLMILFALICLMIFVGGLTRLTDSGLSIVEWKPILGSIPPLSEKKWIIEFDKYKSTPEFLIQNFDISMYQFKIIYWWEWGHRQLGRIIGLVWFFGFLYLLFRKKIPQGWMKRFIFLGMLGGLQGFLGWWMVSSGLEGTMIDVASYRLAIHLTVAFIILSVILWFILILSNIDNVNKSNSINRNKKLLILINIILFTLFLQIIFGALVAGIDAGKSYNDWPLMSGKWFPEDAFYSTSFVMSFFEESGLVQFNHRVLGYIIFILSLVIWYMTFKTKNTQIKKRAYQFLIIVFVQIFLGIITIIYSAPLHLSSAHQVCAILLVSLTLRLYFVIYYPNIAQKS